MALLPVVGYIAILQWVGQRQDTGPIVVKVSDLHRTKSHSRKIVTNPGIIFGKNKVNKNCTKNIYFRSKYFVASVQISIHTNPFFHCMVTILICCKITVTEVTNVVWHLWLYCNKYMIYLFHFKLYCKGFIAAFNRCIILHWYTINQTNRSR